MPRSGCSRPAGRGGYDNRLAQPWQVSCRAPGRRRVLKRGCCQLPLRGSPMHRRGGRVGLKPPLQSAPAPAPKLSTGLHWGALSERVLRVRQRAGLNASSPATPLGRPRSKPLSSSPRFRRASTIWPDPSKILKSMAGVVDVACRLLFVGRGLLSADCPFRKAERASL